MYAGDVTPGEAWALLEAETNAALVDVRTRAEWTFVGVTDLTRLGREPVFLEWQTFPDMSVDTGFAEHLAGVIGEETERAVLFLCRSGARSKSAAEAMTARGYRRCFNITDGFEGPMDSQHHRGGLSGWKADGLPWVQG